VKNKVKILVLTSTFPRWRGDKDPPFVMDLCRRLAAHFSVTVLAPHFPGARVKENIHGIRVMRFRYFFSTLERLAYGSSGGMLTRIIRNPAWMLMVPFFIVGQMVATVRINRQERFDLIHAHWIIPQGLSAVIAKMLLGARMPVLSTAHGGDLYGLRGKAMDQLRQLVYRYSSAVTVVSHGMRRDIVSSGARANKVHVIPMGTDLTRLFRPGGYMRESKQVLFVGRLVEKKGCGYLLKAWPEVVRKDPEARLIIVGDGPERNALQQQIRSLDVTETIRFLGAVDHSALPALYRSSAVVVFPSIVADSGDREGFGLVLVEALGCECAAVVTDLPAMEDIVEHERSALVVPQKDPSAIARAILSLMDDPSLCRRLGENGRRHVLAQFDWRAIGVKYARLMERLIWGERANRMMEKEPSTY
jgi:glycosyltransferase involved in cell wall biosynthesis